MRALLARTRKTLDLAKPEDPDYAQLRCTVARAALFEAKLAPFEKADPWTKPLAELNLRYLALSQRAKELNETVTDKPIPLVESMTLEEPMEHKAAETKQEGEWTVVSGTEYLVPLTATATSGAPGRPLMTYPLSPGMVGSTRLASFAGLFDEYRWEQCEIEYVPTCPMTRAGAMVGFCTADVNEEPFNSETGVGVVRDAVSRPGAIANSVIARVKYGVSFPQQAVYYTANNEVPNLEVGGLFSVAAVSTIDVGDLGLTLLHYRVAFRQSTNQRATPDSNVRGPTTGSLSFTNEVINAGETMSNTATLFNPCTFGSGSSTESIACAVIASLSDGTFGPTWRNFHSDGEAIELMVGRRIWFRLDAASSALYWYSSLGAVLASPPPAYTYHDTYNGALVADSSFNFNAGTAPSMTWENIMSWQTRADFQ